MAYLSQLGVKYDLDDELSIVEGRRSDEIKKGETFLPECEFSDFLCVCCA